MANKFARMRKFAVIFLVLTCVVTIAYVFAQDGHTDESAVNISRISDNPQVFYSNLFTQFADVTQVPLVSPNPSLVGFVQAAENEHLTLYVDPLSLAIKVINRATGYIFSSTLDNMEDHRLNNIWRNRVASAVTIDFLDENGSTAWESLTINDSHVDFTLVDSGFVGNITFGMSGIVIELSVVLDGRDVLISVPHASIIEPYGMQLLELHVYPFFGATKEDEVPGYMFIPDGAGALIRYGDIRTAMSSPWRAYVYGHDLGMGQASIATTRPGFSVSMPIWGKVHGENAFLAIIESGDNYAELFAYTAGLITEFNWMYARFYYRYTFFRPTTRDETRAPSVQEFQEDMNVFDINLRMRFLYGADASYVGLALAYQEFLLERGYLTRLEHDMPRMRLEFFGGEMTEGLIFQQYVAMTPVANIPGYVGRLQGRGVENVLAVYRSFARGGSQSFPSRFPVDRRLGNAATVRQAVQALENAGVPMFFHTDYSRAYVSGGVFGRSDLAVGINGRLMQGGITDYFYISPSVALESARRDANTFSRFGIQHIAIDTTASSLQSSFNNGELTARDSARSNLEEIVEILNPQGNNMLALYAPNAYAWRLASLYFDIPMSSTRYLFVTDSVPFLQIVLRGHVAYFAPFSNFSANWSRDLLRHIEFGAYPSFILTSEPAHLLAETVSNHIFSSQFDAWEDLVVEMYTYVSSALRYVEGQPIVGRRMLAPGVVMVEYANNVRIFVNYTSVNFTYESTVIPSEGFFVLTTP